MGLFLIEEDAGVAIVRWAGRVVVGRGSPGEVRELPADLAALDLLLGDPALLAPIASGWRPEAVLQGRPTISMETYVRLMVVKQRTGWGYETLMAEVSDSLHLRRFCLIALGERVPHESTVRKLTRRLGASVVDELTRCVIAKAQRETRFTARAVRIDSTVVEADVRYPSDAALSLDGARTLARQARRLRALVGADAGRVQDRSRALGRRLRAISRTIGRRTGERKQQVLALTEQAGELLLRSVREARRLALVARARSRGRGAQRKLKAIARLEDSPIVPRGSQRRSICGSPESRSPTGWCRCSTPTPARSARASSGSPTSSATWLRSAR